MSETDNRVPVAVVGAGRMGRHHTRTCANHPGARLVGVVDVDSDRAEDLVEEYGGKAFSTVEALLEHEPNLKAAVVAVPTVYHHRAAEPLLTRGIACLVEKPLAASSEEARALAALAAEHQAVLQVGHTERFNPAVRAVTKLDFTPRFLEVQRVSPMTFRSLDIGVVMDLMIHDLDIVLSLVQSPIKEVAATGVTVLGDHEDITNARLVFENGSVANITASRLALTTGRRMRLISEDGYVSLDYQGKSGIVIQKKGENDAALSDVRAMLEAGKDLSSLDYSDVLNVQQLSMEDDGPGQSDPLTAQLTAFMASATQGEPVIVDAAAGIAAVDAAERVIASVQDHRFEGLDASRID